MKYFLSIILFFSIQTEWIKSTEKSILRINKNANLETEFEEKDKDGKTILKKYITKNESKTVVQYKYGELMDIDISFYENDSLLFAEIIKGKSFIIYKRERREKEPYAFLMEKRTYFKNKEEGIIQTRKINIYENSDIEKLKTKLKNKKFELEKIGEKEYQNLKKKYNRITSLIK